MFDDRIEVAMAAASEEVAKRAKPLRILVVDADNWFRSLLAIKLSGEGHTVTSFSNCYDAWLQAKTDDFDLMLIDIEVPAMTSLELVRRLRLKENAGMIVATSPNVTTRSARGKALFRSHGISHLLGKEAGFDNVFADLRDLINAGTPNSASLD